MTCDARGDITIHHVLTYDNFLAEGPAKPKDKTEVEKLRKETESVLVENRIPRALVPLITDYAGFFSGNPEMPQDTFEEKHYPEERGFFSKIKI